MPGAHALTPTSSGTSSIGHFRRAALPANPASSLSRPDDADAVRCSLPVHASDGAPQYQRGRQSQGRGVEDARTTERPDMVPTRMSCPVIDGLANRFVCPTWTWPVLLPVLGS